MTTRTTLLWILVPFLFSSLARATVTEPNGLVVPLDSNNGEEQLYTMFNKLGEPIDWKADAHEMPATFAPSCGFEAQFLLHEAGSSLGVAWYNATGTMPPDADLHVIVPAGSPVGTKITSSNIVMDPAYKGGAVGFALVGNQTHYTEAQWNVVCSGCQNPGPWIMAVIYQSKNFANTYYVAFEDGSVDANSYGNDGDYNDYVFGFTGITCSGGGQPCDTGMPGICQAGVSQCESAGDVICKGLVSPMPETCNAVDDDCNGMVDDGNGLCPTGDVCLHGKCVPSCQTGEFTCPPASMCDTTGHCVEKVCLNKTCPAGQVCEAGQCKGACDGVTCPLGLVCSAGECVDFCAGVSCPSGQVCQSGACVQSCGCTPCGTGLACDAGSGMCVEQACAGVSCTGGKACKAGQCVDPCTGAVCPSGEMCSGGACVASSGAGGSGGSKGLGGMTGFLGQGGSTGTSHAGSSGKGGASGAAGKSGHAGSTGGSILTPADTTADDTGSAGGCGCEAREGASGLWVPAAVGGLMLMLRRRRKTHPD